MASARNEIRFLLNDREIRISELGASQTLLDFLRLDQGLKGTKEGCAEGDCGACTVLVGRVRGGFLRYEAVNACIRLLASVDLCHVVSVEHLQGAKGGLHPVQQAMVDHHASQCGFCTPGIVMSLYALWMENPTPDENDIETALQGNLCRCTGYEPIVRAALAISDYGDPTRDRLRLERDRVLEKLTGMDDGQRVELTHEADRAILPNNVDDLARVLLEQPQATLVAGSTDVGLWITKFMRDIAPAVFIGHLEGLQHIKVANGAITIGAGVTYSDCEEVMVRTYPHLAGFWPRIGGQQVRNMGTLGGNIANGSPIGDTPPALIALNARIVLRNGATRRSLLLEQYFLDYGKQDRLSGEFLEEIHIPAQASGAMLAVYKISKRRDEDISSVCAAFNVTVEKGTVTGANLAFGGMAATPKRATRCEAALMGKLWCEETVRQAAGNLTRDFAPLTDWRATKEYRGQVAQNMLLRFYLENSATGVRTRLLRA